MKVRSFQSFEGKQLVSVTFTRQGQEAHEPEIEVVYELVTPEDFTIRSETFGLTPLSATRTDTRTRVRLTPEERSDVLQRALAYAAEALQPV